MTIYQEEMIRKANRYGCDTAHDEGSGRLQVTYNGQYLMDVDVHGHLYYTARDQPDEDVEDMRTALLEEGREIREYVEAYETAIDEMLSSTALWSDIEFEKGALESGKTQRDIGLLVAIISLVVLGTALFSTLIQIKNSKIIWLFGIVIFFSGAYLSYSADGVSFWSESVVSNTTILGCSMMFYMFFLSVALVHFLKNTKIIGTITVTLLGIANAVFLVLPILTGILFYDTWLYWVGLLGCLIWEFCVTKGKDRWLYIGSILPLISFGVDVVMTYLGLWKDGVSSQYVFAVLRRNYSAKKQVNSDQKGRW